MSAATLVAALAVWVRAQAQDASQCGLRNGWHANIETRANRSYCHHRLSEPQRGRMNRDGREWISSIALDSWCR